MRGGEGLFYDCPLKTLYLGRNISYKAGSFYGCSPFSYITTLKSVTIGNSVTSIGEFAFADCSGLTSITIPNSVTSIGGVAFRYCRGLTSVTIPNSVTSIGDDAFRYCRGLESIIIESGNTIYDSRNNCNAIIETSTNTLITGCKNTSIPEGVTSIGEWAFDGCSGLTSITIPNSVTSIGDEAFRDCSGLTSVVFNAKNCTTMGSSSYPVFRDCTNLASIIIGDKVKKIPNYAFYKCYCLTSVTIGNSVTSIGYSAFEDCSRLTSVNISDLEAWCKIDFSGYYSNPLYYAKNLYLNGKLLTNLEIPNSVTSIGDYAFYKCYCLTSVTIGNSVTSIGDYAFNNCSGLTSVTIGNSVTSIGSSAFYNCSGLTSVTIGNSVTSIGDDAFYNCTNLTEVTLGSSVKYIGKYAFSGAERLGTIYSFNPTPPNCIDEDVFYGVSKDQCRVYVPVGAGIYYKIAIAWRHFTYIEEKEMSGVESTLTDNEVNVVVENGNIIVNGAEGANIEVYSTNGLCVYNGTDTGIAVNTKGLYIVKVNGKSFKVIL